METGTKVYHLPGCYEPFSAISHLLGAVFFLILGYLLLRRGRGDRSRLIYLGIYAVSCVVLMTISGMYHMAVRGSPGHRILERLDHSAIFLLIAGTFTPIHGLLFQGWLRWGPLLFVWGTSIVSMIFKLIFFEYVPEGAGFTLYMLIGWSGLFTAVVLARRYGLRFIKPLLIGGAAYSVGGINEYFQGWMLVPGFIHSHELFHLAVLMGACYHWLFIWQFVRGAPAGVRLAINLPRPQRPAEPALPAQGELVSN